MELKFKGETFKIIQLTDVHLHIVDGMGPEKKAFDMIRAAVKAENPDFIAVTGDLSYSEHNASCYRAFSALMDELEIPWGLAFGNHDNELGVSKGELCAILKAGRYSQFSIGPLGLSGMGNYFLTVSGEDEKPLWALAFLDSGSNNPLPAVRGYDYIKLDQIEWFKAECGRISGGEPVPTLAFFHIPLPEYDFIWNTKNCLGSKHESVACPRINSGMFTAMLETGAVKGVFVGHDHINDYAGTHFGIRLCYGKGSGFPSEGGRRGTYSREAWLRGCRVIELDREGAFASHFFLEDGSTVPEGPAYEPEAL